MFRRSTTTAPEAQGLSSPVYASPPPVAIAGEAAPRRQRGRRRGLWAALCFCVFAALLTAAQLDAPLRAQDQYSHTYAYNAIGNITSYNGNAYSYGTKPHAVTGAFGNSYGYDAMGNQTGRTIGGTAYTQTFDYDSRLTRREWRQRERQLPL